MLSSPALKSASICIHDSIMVQISVVFEIDTGKHVYKATHAVVCYLSLLFTFLIINHEDGSQDGLINCSWNERDPQSQLFQTRVWSSAYMPTTQLFVLQFTSEAPCMPFSSSSTEHFFQNQSPMWKLKGNIQWCCIKSTNLSVKAPNLNFGNVCFIYLTILQ